MIRSMTGFGQAASTAPGLRVAVQVRSVNNRFADLKMRLPDALSSLEGELRRIALSRFRRGRVDLEVRVERDGSDAPVVTLNRPMVAAVLGVARDVKASFGVPGDLDVTAVLQIPGALESMRPTDLSEEGRDAVVEAVGDALGSLDADRLREGAALADDVARRLGRMRESVRAIRERAPDLPRSIQARLEERLQALLGSGAVDPGRLAQEVAFLADRADVTEELVRLDGHLEQAHGLLASPDGEAVGKRLDFLLQEIHRETNTLCSKSADLGVTRIALDLKSEAERVREQAQNLE